MTACPGDPICQILLGGTVAALLYDKLFQIGWRWVRLFFRASAFYHPFDQWCAAAYCLL